MGRIDTPLTAAEFLRYERRWKLIFLLFGIMFGGAIIDFLMLSPHGMEVAFCILIGVFGFLGCLYSANKLGDDDRLDATLEALNILDDD